MVKKGNKLVFQQGGSGKDMSFIQNNRCNEKIMVATGKRCVRFGPDGGTTANEQ